MAKLSTGIKTINMPIGSTLIFGQEGVHQGFGYREENYRIFVYADINWKEKATEFTMPCFLTNKRLVKTES